MHLGAGNNANLITAAGRNTKHAYPREQDKPTRNQHISNKESTPPSATQAKQNHHNNRNNHRSLYDDEEEEIVFPSDFQYVYQNGQDSQEFEEDGLNSNQILEIGGSKFSPIANTYMEDNDPFPKYLQDRPIRDTVASNRFRDQEKVRNNRPQSPGWKQFLNPDVQKYYDSIMKNRQNNKLSRQKTTQALRKPSSQYSHEIEYESDQIEMNQELGNEQISEKNYAGYKSQKSHNLSVGNQRIKETRNKSTMQNELEISQVEDLRKRYEDKINVLEHQNNNLKDELFYLRAAILAQYEAREQVMATRK